MSNTHLSTIPFKEFELEDAVLKGIHDAGFLKATPIQAGVLPIALSGQDVAGKAQTGTGKTAAFLIVAFNRLIKRSAAVKRRPNQPRAIILAPTRELAIQIHREAALLGKHTGLRIGLAYGGVDYEKQRQQLIAGLDVLIGTPGRIIDYFKQKVFDLRAIEIMVLDEADRMLDLGFIKDIRYLLRRMPPPEKRLSMLFSATLSYRVMELAYEHMNNPTRVQTEAEQITADHISESVFFPANAEKIPLLLGLLERDRPARSIVFCNTKRSAERVAEYLESNGHTVALLSGAVPQKKRQGLLKAFSEGRRRVLVATDVAARGLHIPDVTHVFNFDLPQSAEDYVHRIGRTGRAGARGVAISFACEDTAFYLPEIETYVGHKLQPKSTCAELMITPVDPARRNIQRTRSTSSRKGKTGVSNSPDKTQEDRAASSAKTRRRSRRSQNRSTEPVR